MSLENTPPTPPPNPVQPGSVPPAPAPAPAPAPSGQSTPAAAEPAPAGPTPPVQGPSAPNAFSTIAPRAWRGAVASAGIGYGAALVVALITVALTGLLTSWELFSAGWLVSGPVQLVALSTFGQLGVAAEVEFFVSFAGAITVGVLPILVLAGLVAATYISSRVVGRGIWHGSSALILSGVTGFTLAVGTTVLAAVLPLQLPDVLGSPFGSASAASAGSFIGALVLGFGVSYLARLQATDGWSRFVARATWLPWGTLRIAALHLGTLIAVLAVVLAIALPLAVDEGVMGALPALLLTIAINAAVIGMLGAFSVDLSDVQRLLTSFGGSSDQPAQPYFSAFSDGVFGYAWLLVLLAVLLAVGASLLLAVRRNAVPPSSSSWLATITSYTAFGLLVQLLGSATVTASMTAPSNVTAAGSFGPAAWTFLIFAVWGAAVEAFARFGAPILLAAAPPTLIRGLVTLAGQERLVVPVGTIPVSADATGSESAGTSAAGAAVPAGTAYAADSAAGRSDASPLAFATTTMSPATAKRVKIGAVVVGGAVLLIVIASVAGGIVRSSVFGPQNVATAYLKALEDGDATTALTMIGSPADAGDGLLANDVFGLATDRIEDAAISDVTITGDVAQIEVHFKQGGTSDSAVLKLTRTSTDWLIADQWSILNAQPGQIEVYTPSSLGNVDLEANGSTVGRSEGGGLALAAFPGTYELTIPATDYFEESSVTYVVSGLLGGYGESESYDDTFTATPTDAYEGAALEAVNTLITTCLASPGTESDDCPYLGYISTFYANVVYTLVTPPELTVEAAYDGGGLRVSTDTRGVVKVEYDVDYGFSSEVDHRTDENDLKITADVKVVDGEVVVTSAY